MNYRVLALDTATEACSAALLCGQQILERFELAPREHTKLILPMVDELLAEAGISLGQLDGIAFGRGPGSFTGLRIAAGVTQGLAMGADLPVMPVSDLAALALQAHDSRAWSEVAVCQDARLQEFFLGFYRVTAESVEPIGQECLVTAEGLQQRLPAARFAVGSGWRAEAAEHLDVSGLVMDPDICLPRAKDILRLGTLALHRGQAVPPELALPVYLREQVASKSAPGG
jgi:tRNA threonylcarbamoyladenosine biosynthesis protein TsaB